MTKIQKTIKKKTENKKIEISLPGPVMTSITWETELADFDAVDASLPIHHLIIRDVLCNNYKQTMLGPQEERIPRMKHGISESNLAWLKQHGADSTILRELSLAFFYYPLDMQYKIMATLPFFEPFSTPITGGLFFGGFTKKEDFMKIARLRIYDYFNNHWKSNNLHSGSGMNVEILNDLIKEFPSEWAYVNTFRGAQCRSI